MHNLACMYRISKNYEKAIELYERAIKCGSMRAMTYLARLYGDNFNKNYKTIIKLYEFGIQKGNSESMNDLAIMYQCGKYVGQDSKKAFELFNMAINVRKNNASVSRNLAFMYTNGCGTNINYDMAAKYYTIYCNKEKVNLNEYLNLSEYDIIWETYLHKYWPNKEVIDVMITTLLLISKFKQSSKYDYVKYFIKGISMIVIRYVCMINKIM